MLQRLWGTLFSRRFFWVDLEEATYVTALGFSVYNSDILVHVSENLFASKREIVQSETKTSTVWTISLAISLVLVPSSSIPVPRVFLKLGISYSTTARRFLLIYHQRLGIVRRRRPWWRDLYPRYDASKVRVTFAFGLFLIKAIDKVGTERHLNLTSPSCIKSFMLGM